MIKMIVFAFLVIAVFVADGIRQELKYRAEIKKWHANSFECDGGRYSKDFFDAIDGKPVMKKNGNNLGIGA